MDHMTLIPSFQRFLKFSSLSLLISAPVWGWAQHGVEATRCEVVLSSITKAALTFDEKHEQTSKALVHLKRFLNSVLVLDSDPKNSVVHADSGSNEKSKKLLAARISAILKDAHSSSPNDNVFATSLEGAEAIRAELQRRQNEIRVLIEKDPSRQIEDESRLIAILETMEEGKWAFSSSDFRVPAQTANYLLKTSHWPEKSEREIEVVTGNGLLVSKLLSKLSAILNPAQPDKTQSTWVRLDTLLAFNRYSQQPVLIDIVRYHKDVPDYESMGPSGGQRDDQELTLEEQARLLEEQGLVPIRIDLRRRHRH